MQVRVVQGEKEGSFLVPGNVLDRAVGHRRRREVHLHAIGMQIDLLLAIDQLEPAQQTGIQLKVVDHCRPVAVTPQSLGQRRREPELPSPQQVLGQRGGWIAGKQARERHLGQSGR